MTTASVRSPGGSVQGTHNTGGSAGRAPEARLLVVDDEPNIRELLSASLRYAGFEVATAADGQQALAMASSFRPDLLVLDVMMPGLDGLEVCRRLRVASDVPIILLTALGSEQDRVVGLEIGADDYVTKPFSPRELVLRVDSILRRSTGGLDTDVPAVLVDGDLVVDRARRLVTMDGEETALTARELDLLAFLVARPGVAFSRDDLLQQVWGWSFGDQSTVTVHVRRLREKVEADPTNPVRLRTVWGVGYRWETAS
jgi:DNA-binding response OmpR family regulator